VGKRGSYRYSGTGFVRAFTRAMVQAPGVASRIAVSHFRRAVAKSEAINDLLTRYHMALMCQVCAFPPRLRISCTFISTV
jgi:hypothetical protein